MADQGDGTRKDLKSNFVQGASGQDQVKKAAPASQSAPDAAASKADQLPPGMESLEDTKRRMLRDQTKGQVTGTVQRGVQTVLDNDWGAANGQSSADRYRLKQEAAKKQQSATVATPAAPERQSAPPVQKASVQQAPQAKPAAQQGASQTNAAAAAQAQKQPVQQQEVSEQAYRSMLAERGRKALERDRAQARQQGPSNSQDRD